MKDSNPQVIHLKDYTQPTYFISHVDLSLKIFDGETKVSSVMKLTQNTAVSGPIHLHGVGLTLDKIVLNGTRLAESDYVIEGENLFIDTDQKVITLEIENRINPEQNTALEGLYKSRIMYCTQCEAEGFRRITYFMDRPDVLATYRVRVEADSDTCPVLLSNGNLEETGDLANGRHFAVWHDPYPKPSYLFALVAGDLQRISDTFETMNGRNVNLYIYAEAKDLDKCDHAMASLKRSMKWDEEVYGREYDLDIFNIVAVDDFNMGAMENKSLNIFNTSAVLARPETTTDATFQRVEAIVAHEYFHNWSGNRVTCRDWFQLSLKEGFTVFRDAEFSADMGSRAVKRIEDVAFLRSRQFAEDAGPMAHPVRPASFIEISNFYTLTVYEKGCEVVRMIHTLLGADMFRKGSDLYFERNDGKAATIEDFISAMSDVSGYDFSDFMNWYSQAGTPVLSITDEYDEAAQTYTLHLKQSCPVTPESDQKAPFVIPIQIALLGEAGALPLSLNSPEVSDNTEYLHTFTTAAESIVFEKVTERPVPSLLRNFSAPVVLEYDYTEAQLLFIMSHDSDGFNRWDAAQRLFLKAIEAELGGEQGVNEALISACKAVVQDAQIDGALKSLTLTLPSEAQLQQRSAANPVALHNAREAVANQLAEALSDEFKAAYSNNILPTEYAADADSIAARQWSNCALSYLTRTGDLSFAQQQFAQAGNMTEQFGALAVLYKNGDKAALQSFYEQWKHETLVMNSWLALQASCTPSSDIEDVKALLASEVFDINNPNKVRSVLGVFGQDNANVFHHADGSGYALLAEYVAKMDKINPQVAARILTPLTRWNSIEPQRGEKMKSALATLAADKTLSKDVFEVVNKSLIS